jgi:hypothetical protein
MNKDWEFASGPLAWLVFLREGKISMRCNVAHEGGAGIGFESASRKYNYEMVANRMQDVYEGLPFLVESMLKTFPHLGRLLEPFFRAAEKQL